MNVIVLGIFVATMLKTSTVCHQ